MSNLRSLASALMGAALAASFAACGGSGNETSAATNGTGGSSSATTGTSGTGGGTSSTSGTGGGASSSTASSTASSTSSSSGGSGALTADLVSMDLYINCQPIVAEDPVIGSFTASYDNKGAAPQSATVSVASLTLTKNGQSLGWPFAVSPPAGGPVQPNTTLSVQHAKQKKAGSIEGFPCEFCGGEWSLSVTWDLGGGVTATDSLPASPVSCVY